MFSLVISLICFYCKINYSFKESEGETEIARIIVSF